MEWLTENVERVDENGASIDRDALEYPEPTGSDDPVADQEETADADHDEEE